MKIEELDDYVLLQHFKNAVCDNNYNPSSENYNQSEFAYDDLENEILRRMNRSEELDLSDMY